MKLKAPSNDRSGMKEFTRMGKKLGYGFLEIKMDRRVLKKLGKMGEGFHPYVGMKMGMNVNVVKIGGKVVNRFQI